MKNVEETGKEKDSALKEKENMNLFYDSSLSTFLLVHIVGNEDVGVQR